ncbi:MAG TPA: acetyl-CoA carboxylase biotin carboxyl carrier protein [Thermomicrobiaceae bacterium]|nr:acetyl-CoA carboxylase biotin carboxyl carrier protein [Thermomicrobiaceae bacterium]
MSTTTAPSDSPATSPADEYAALTGAVRELVAVMRQGGIGQLEVCRGDLRISLSAASVAPPAGAAHAHGVAGPEHPLPTDELAPDEGTVVVTSPMIGTYYAGAAPGEPPFIHVGDAVEVGQTVAIIEAMKIMNEIVAEHAGIVEQILVRDGEPVEYGHPLLRLRVRA